MAKRRRLTKSRFKPAPEYARPSPCYAGKSDYADQNLDDSFLSLCEAKAESLP